MLGMLVDVGIASVFLYGAWSKLARPHAWRLALTNYRIRLLRAPRLATVVPFLEVIIAVSVATGIRPWAPLAASLLCVAFSLVLLTAFRRGATGDCGCFGGSFRAAIGPLAIARALAIATIAVWRAGPWSADMTDPAVSLGLTAAVFITLQLRDSVRELLTRPRGAKL